MNPQCCGAYVVYTCQ